MFNLQVQRIGCARLKDVGADASLFLLDAAMENRIPDNNDSCDGTPLGDGTRKKKCQSSAAMV